MARSSYLLTCDVRLLLLWIHDFHNYARIFYENGQRVRAQNEHNNYSPASQPRNKRTACAPSSSDHSLTSIFGASSSINP